MNPPLADNLFRANVGAVIINTRGEVLTLERIDIKDAWQLPQGGLDEDEDTLDAVFREIQEETGIDRSQLELIAEHPDWLAYELSPEKRSGKHGRGQVQKWFLLRFCGDDREINITDVETPEFSAWRWMRLADLSAITAPFRRPIYEKLRQAFSEYLS